MSSSQGKHEITTKWDASDGLPFYGNKMPSNIAALKSSMLKVNRTLFQKILRLAVSSLEGKAVQLEQFEHLSTNDVQLEKVHIIYAGILKILQCAFSKGKALNQSEFKNDLKPLNISEDATDDLVSVVYGTRRAALVEAIRNQKPSPPTIVDFKWKINVVISNNESNRVMEPTVATQMILSNGQVKNMELSVAEFQSMRYNVASMLKAMEDLEKKSIMKPQ